MFKFIIKFQYSYFFQLMDHKNTRTHIGIDMYLVNSSKYYISLSYCEPCILQVQVDVTVSVSARLIGWVGVMGFGALTLWLTASSDIWQQVRGAHPGIKLAAFVYSGLKLDLQV